MSGFQFFFLVCPKEGAGREEIECVKDLTYDCAFGGCVAPWFIVTGEDAQMTSTHKFFIVQCQNWIVTVQEIGVEDDLNAIVCVVEQFDAPDLIEDRVVRVVGHIVRGDGWEDVAFECEYASLE